MTTPALFLDRDGTLVHPRHYPSRPEDLILVDNIEPELRTLQATGFILVLITNQSGLARGLFTAVELDRMHDHLTTELANRGVRLDGIYHCPHHPDGVVPALACVCDCRKPAPGMLLRAAEDLQLDLDQSWFIGDILDDVEAGHHAGCRTILVDIGTESFPTSPERQPDLVARDTAHALRLVAMMAGVGTEDDTSYRPASWHSSPEAPEHHQPLALRT